MIGDGVGAIINDVYAGAWSTALSPVVTYSPILTIMSNHHQTPKNKARPLISLPHFVPTVFSLTQTSMKVGVIKRNH